MFGGGRSSSSKSKSKASNSSSNINPAGGGGGDGGAKEKLIPNLEMDDDHFFYSSRLISREPANSNNNHPSFRVYYGDASLAVPFTWESQPGTPKSKFHIDSDRDRDGRHIISYSAPLPPLTPPPSYFSSSAGAATGGRRQLSKKQSSSFRTWPTKLFMGFRKQRPSNNNYSVGSSSSSSDNSASLSPTRSITSTRDQRHSSDNLLYSRRKVSSLEALLDLKLEGSDPDGGSSSSAAIVDGSGSGSGSSPTSTLCFGGSSRVRGRYGWL